MMEDLDGVCLFLNSSFRMLWLGTLLISVFLDFSSKFFVVAHITPLSPKLYKLDDIPHVVAGILCNIFLFDSSFET